MSAFVTNTHTVPTNNMNVCICHERSGCQGLVLCTYYIWHINQTYTVASAPSVTGSGIMQRSFETHAHTSTDFRSFIQILPAETSVADTQISFFLLFTVCVCFSSGTIVYGFFEDAGSIQESIFLNQL